MRPVPHPNPQLTPSAAPRHASNNASLPFQFHAANQALIREVLSRYPSQYRKAAVMPSSTSASAKHAFTSISVMNEVARQLAMPPMRVYEVATFYTMYNRAPVGKFHLQCCTTTPCQLGGAGSDAIMSAIQSHLALTPGQTSPDNLFTLSEVECLGACVNAPMLQINDDYYEDLTPESVVRLLDALRHAATAVAASPSPAPVKHGGQGNPASPSPAR